MSNDRLIQALADVLNISPSRFIVWREYEFRKPIVS